MIKLALTSDTHGNLKWLDEVPPCDILIHAGDIAADSYKKVWCREFPGFTAIWLREFLIPKVQHLIDEGIIKHFVATFGNHDWATRAEAQALSTDNIHFLVDTQVELMGLTIHGSPWSNEFNGWAWMKLPQDLDEIYKRIPSGIDVLISHQPPICAGYAYPNLRTGVDEWVGSVELEAEIPRISPQLVVCGHLHSGHGTYPLGETTIINAAYLNEQYRPTYPIETFTLLPRQREVESK